jgi:hypothetical protein
VNQLLYYQKSGYFADIPANPVDLGDIVAGHAPARKTASELTVCVNLGLALEDVVTAQLIYQLALDKGAVAVNRVMGLELFMDSGRVAGVVGINVRSGELVVGRAKAVILAARAGYDPFGLPTVLQDIGHMARNDNRVSLLFKTHPHPDQRLSQLPVAEGLVPTLNGPVGSPHQLYLASIVPEDHLRYEGTILEEIMSCLHCQKDRENRIVPGICADSATWIE